MFESILNKLLQQYLGKFISGLNTNNLKVGVWSGNIVLENVQINKEIFQLINIPLNLNFGLIGKLKISVPWNKLSSSPVEIHLENVFIVISPESFENLNLLDFNSIENKLKNIESFAKEQIKKFAEKSEEIKEKSGNSYLSKMIIRIVDNIQINIKNIHIRLERKSNNFSMGVILKSLEVFTTDEKWKKNFLDRTKEENKNLPMYKHLNLEKFGIYWNFDEKNFIGKNENDKIQEFMKNFISQDSKDNNFIIKISTDLFLIQHPKSVVNQPEIKVKVDIESFDIFMRKEQIQQLLQLLAFVNDFNSILIKKKK